MNFDIHLLVILFRCLAFILPINSSFNFRAFSLQLVQNLKKSVLKIEEIGY